MYLIVFIRVFHTLDLGRVFKYSFQIRHNEKYDVHRKIFDTINPAFTKRYCILYNENKIARFALKRDVLLDLKIGDFSWKSVPQHVYPWIVLRLLIDQSHKFHNALDEYTTMHHFLPEVFTHVHISVKNGALWNMGLVHCGICATDLLIPDCWDPSGWNEKLR